MSASVSRRESASRGVFAWSVDRDPSCPVFIAWSMSSASPPRTSPMMMRSGRIRNALRSRSRVTISPRPSMLGGRPFEAHDVPLREAQLGAVLDRHDALVVGDHRRQHVQQRRLAAARTAAHEDVRAPLHAGAEEVRRLIRHRSDGHQVVDGERVRAELPNREHRSVDRERRDDRVHPRAVGKARVDHRRELVDSPTDRCDDPVDHLEDVLVGEEVGVGEGDLAVAFDVDALEAVHHDLGDRRIGQVALDRPVAQHLVGDRGDELITLGRGQRDLLFVQDDPELLDGDRVELAKVSSSSRRGSGPCARAALPARAA